MSKEDPTRACTCPGQARGRPPKERHEFYLFHGDVLHVTGDLSRYWHVTRPCATDTRRRISLVFKCRRPPDLPPHLRGPTAAT